MPYIGVIRVQTAGCRIVAIALFGHRQRDDPNRRVRHRVQHSGGVFGRDENVVQNLDPARRLAVRAQRDNIVGPTLWGAVRRAWRGLRNDTPMIPQSPPDAAMASAT